MESTVIGTVLFVVFIPAVTPLCLEFRGGSWLEFPDKVNLNNSVHFKFSVKTLASTGDIFFAKGPRYDFERLYLSEGVLNYFLFNPTHLGNGGTFGTHVLAMRKEDNGYMEPISIADNQWHTVEFFRNVRLPGMNHTSTGLIVDGQKTIDSRVREGVFITPPFFIGGSPNHQDFVGIIKDFEEIRNGFLFHETSHPMGVKRYSQPPC